jgi:3-oxoacyl-[acyl-carrier-protein] synthase-3
MAHLRAFGCYLPERVVDNQEIASSVGAEASWILQASGIEQRRFAAPDETVASMGIRAARDCLTEGVFDPDGVGLILVSSGSAERRFPGPAAEIVSGLGLAGTPAIDLPMASAGSLFGIALAAQLTGVYRNVLVVASEIMSRAVRMDASGRDTAILFGDGAGACLVGAGGTGSGQLRPIIDSVLHSDGEFADALSLGFDSPIRMDGRTIILQAARKLPRAIGELLERNNTRAADVAAFVMHQANLNLITRVAQALGVPEDKFFRNVQRYGNTSSASMLIAAAEFYRGPRRDGPVVLAAFGAGLNWGAALIGQP